jgi:hypothetical protein
MATPSLRRPMTSRLIVQMKADSSRAIAVATTVGRLPLRMSDRKRPHNLVCAPRQSRARGLRRRPLPASHSRQLEDADSSRKDPSPR